MKKHRYAIPLSPFWQYLRASGCDWKRKGKSRQIYGDVAFDTQAGKQLRLPADICFHGKVRVTQTNRLSPNIVFAGDFHILAVALGTISEGRLPRLRIPKNTRFMSSVFLNTWHGEWPGNIHTIKGHFFWTYSYVRKLPKIFHVKDDINISGSRIKQFPTKLIVYGDTIMPGICLTKCSWANKLRFSFSMIGSIACGTEHVSIPGNRTIHF